MKDKDEILITFETLFKNKFFCIPKYQRAYAWEEKQINDLMDDIKNQSNDLSYYMGTLILQKDGGLYNIVDGQQRITSITLLVKAILDILENKKINVNEYIRKYIVKNNQYKLDLSTNEEEVFRKILMSKNCNISNIKTKTLAQKRLIKAYKQIYEEFENQKEEELFSYLNIVDNIEFLVYMADDEASSVRIFETTNDRGISLNELDKMKSFFMYKIYVLVNKKIEKKQKLETLRNRFQSIFENASILENDLLKIGIDENTILRSHFIAYYDWKYYDKYIEIYDEDGDIEVDEQGNKKTRRTTIKEYNNHLDTIKKYINNLIKEGKTKEALEYIETYTDELKSTFENLKVYISKESYKNLQNLETLGRMAKFMPLIIKTYQKDKSHNKSNFERINKLLEIYAFRVLGVGGKYTYTGETKFFDLAKNFMKNSNNVEEEFNNLAINILNRIKEYEKSYTFENELKNPQLYKEKKNIAKYCLWQYENYLREKDPTKTYPQISKKDYVSKKNRSMSYSIEHIIPQDYEKNNLENVIYTKNLSIDLQEKEFEEKYLNCIGNLVIDTLGSNSSKGAKATDIKDKKYFKESNFLSQKELNNYVRIKGKKWNKDSINNRMDDIVEFAKNRWKIEDIQEAN